MQKTEYLPPITKQGLERLQRERFKFQSSMFAANTEKAYAHDWLMFCRFAERAGLAALPATPETVALYLTDLLCRGRTVATAMRRTSGITHYHRRDGFETPVSTAIWELLAGAMRARRERPRQKQPLTIEQLRLISAALRRENSAKSIRNRAAIVLGFATALRGASLVSLDVGDVEWVQGGLVILVRREKQDRAGKGRKIGVTVGSHPETCPLSCLRAWLALRGTAPGPLFCRVREKGVKPLVPCAVRRMVKDGIRRIGLDASSYGGHSLRAGFITAAGEANIGHLRIANQTGHRSMDILRRYFRPSQLLVGNPCVDIGL